MTEQVSVSIVGGSGYVGGELVRLLLFHPFVRLQQVTSEHLVGKSISKAHPNLRKISDLKFTSISELDSCDVLFSCLPHGDTSKQIDFFLNKAQKIIDLSSDFRLHRKEAYEKWYHYVHPRPELLEEFVYGIPELHREKIQRANLISSAGCNATASILGLYPLFKHNIVDTDRTVIEVKNGSSEGGSVVSSASHHPERSGSVRSYMPTQHRHIAEIVQELSINTPIHVHFSATSLDMVRGILATCHVFLDQELSEKDVWKIYRGEYGLEPFIRMVKENEGIYRYPEPKLLTGTNYCDIGFEKDMDTRRVVIISAIDNLMKGAAGQAVQAFNIRYGFEETTGLQFPGLHPI